jgi:hypothetical protein
MAEDYAFLKKIDDAVNFTSSDFAAEYSIAKRKVDGGVNATTVALFRRDREAEFLILILKPETDKGKGYLMRDGTVVFYDPADRRFTSSNAQDVFRNSDARNSDFSLSSLARDYSVVSESRERLGSLDCRKLELQSAGTGAPFFKKVVWATDDGVLRMSREYSRSLQLLRTVAYQYRMEGARALPTKIVIVNELKAQTIDGVLRKETTTIDIAKHSLSALPANLFSTAYLEGLSQ